MPTYDYTCKSCGHRWELFQSMTAKPVKACPECGKKTAERLIGIGAAVLFKGDGFYQTDYRSESYKKAAAADAPKADAPKADAPKADTPKAESTPKPEAKKAEPASKPAKGTQPKGD
jgi:putative FmdB family regulatory protein